MNFDVVNVDITNGLQDVISLILNIFKYSFEFMRGIEFFGTNLFSFIVTVFLLLIILPILFTLVRSEAVNNERIRERINKSRSRKKGD